MCQIIMTETSHDKYQARFIAIQFLLNNMQIANELNSEVVNKLSSLRDQVAEQVGAVSVRREMERIRNHYIETLLQDVVTYPDEDKQYFSSRIDKILTHKYIGMPIFEYYVVDLSNYIYMDWHTFVGSTRCIYRWYIYR